MRRREFLGVLSSAAIAMPITIPVVAADGATSSVTIADPVVAAPPPPPAGDRADISAVLAPIFARGPVAPQIMRGLLANVVDVKTFGAVANGVADDTSAVQGAINTSFGGGANKPLWFPPGNYRVRNLTFPALNGAIIVGAGAAITALDGTVPVVAKFNGMVNTWIEGLGINTLGTATAWEIDDPNNVGLHDNTFFFCSSGQPDHARAAVGFRIAKSGFGGANNTFFACGGNELDRAFQIVGPNAIGQAFVRSEGQACNICWHVLGGEIASISGTSQAICTWDIVIENNSSLLMQGGRTESPNFLKFTAGGTAKVRGFNMTIRSGPGVQMTAQSKLILEAASVTSVVGGGTLVLGAGRPGDLSQFTGTIIQET